MNTKQIYMKKLFYTLVFILATVYFLPSTIYAATKAVTIVNPIRGEDFWSSKDDILATAKGEYQSISQNGFAATWLIRYDALSNPNVVSFLKTMDQRQEKGLFFEVTPSLTKDAGVTYNPSPNWHYPQSAFLVGYSPPDRKKLIDSAMNKYKEIFGSYPKSVGAWWIDAYSLGYLHDQYGVIANLDVSDQYSTDQYQIWGQYFSLPFYPAKLNALMPAQSADHKIGVITIQWATRDPYNSYGNGVNESTYSVQVNDYILHNLDYKYFGKLLDIYPQVTVGMENDFSWNQFGQMYSDQIKLLSQRSDVLEQTMSNYAQSYVAQNPEISPKVLFSADDPLNSGGKVVWYQTPRYRVGLFLTPQGVAIRDLRIYNDTSKEPCLEQSCNQLNLAKSFLNAIDDITYADALSLDQGGFTNFKLIQNNNGVEVDYTNQGGSSRTVRFLNNDIEINGKIKTVDGLILDTFTAAQQQQKNTQEENVSSNILPHLPELLVNLIKFLVFSVFFFFIPGWLLTRKLLLSIPVGWVLFTLLGFVLGYLRLEKGLLLIPVISVVWWIKERPRVVLPRLNWRLIALVVIGSFTWLLTTFKSGLLYGYGLGFWGPNGHDAIWHLALISELQKNVPPSNPVFAGMALQNYHYFFDLLLALSSKLFWFSNLDLLFRWFPLFIALLSGFLIYSVTTKLTNQKAGLIATFFMYFGGSFGWVVSYFRDRSLGGESLFWSQQSISTLLNPPFAISLVFLLAGLEIFIRLIKNEQVNKWERISLILLWGTLIEFKVYAGVLVLAALGLVSMYKLLKGQIEILKISLPILVLSLLVFLPNNLGAQSLLIFSPFWLVNSMVDFPDRLGWERLAMARQAYGATGNFIKFVGAEFVGLLIYLTGNMGSRIVILVNLFKKKAFDEVSIFLTAVIILGFVLPLLFIQKGNDWNIIQFFYYSLILSSIFIGIGLSSVLVKLSKPFGSALLIGIILLTFPTTWDTLQQYIPQRPPAKLSQEEYLAIQFLKAQPKGTVLTLPFNEKKKDSLPTPLPLFAYTSTAYVSAFSGHSTFLEDTINLEILGVDVKARLNDEEDFMRLPERSRFILKKDNISYVYIPKSLNFQENESEMGISKIFENSEVKIFKVQ